MDQTVTDDLKSSPLERYFRIVEVLCGFPAGLALADIAALLSIPRQSAHRLLANMQAAKLIAVTGGRNQRYVLADRIRRIAVLAIDDGLVRSLTSDLLKRLCAEVGETTYLARIQGSEIHSVAMESPDTPWRGFVLPGKILQPHATASGKAIMAFQPKEVADSALGANLERFTLKTLTTRADIEKEYARIRQRGYATCLAEVDDNLAAIAVPVEIEGVGVQYSLGLVGPLKRITELVKEKIFLKMQPYAKSISSAVSVESDHRSA